MLYLNSLLRQQYSHNHNDSLAMNSTMLMVIIGTLFPSWDGMITVISGNSLYSPHPLKTPHHRNSNKHPTVYNLELTWHGQCS